MTFDKLVRADVGAAQSGRLRLRGRGSPDKPRVQLKAVPRPPDPLADAAQSTFVRALVLLKSGARRAALEAIERARNEILQR